MAKKKRKPRAKPARGKKPARNKKTLPVKPQPTKPIPQNAEVGLTENERQCLLMRRRRSAAREIEVPACADPDRRKKCEADPELWLQTYLPHKFFNPFTLGQKEMIQATFHKAQFGGDEAIADSRGSGKSSLIEGLALMTLCMGIVGFPVGFGANRLCADQLLDHVKHELEHNELLCADYPEICAPIWAIEGEPRKAGKQTHNGRPTMLRWWKSMIVLPTIEGSKASGGVFATRGLHSAVRGLRYVTRRPDFAFIDDPETADSAINPKQVAKRRQLIDRDIAGLAGPGKTIARVAAVTLLAAGCLADELTDPTKSPGWKCFRFRMLVQWPERMDLWEEYVRLFQAGQNSGDLDGRNAHNYYLAHQALMDAGAVVSNPCRYINKLSADGTPLEVSAVQHAFNWIARMGQNGFETEFQNNPPATAKPDTLGITPELVAGRVNYYQRFIVPSEALCLTAQIDLGKTRCHYAQQAWIPGHTGLVADYGYLDVGADPKADQHDESVKAAIFNTLLRWREILVDDHLLDTRGEFRKVSLAMVDSGDWSDVVYRFILEVGGLPFVASKGFSASTGGSFHAGKDIPGKRISGNHWWIARQDNADVWLHGASQDIWLYGFDGDHWKHRVHHGFLTPTFHDDKRLREGSLSFWQPERPHEHLPCGRHVTADEWRETFTEGKGWRKSWVQIRRENHLGDALVMGSVAHDIWLTRVANSKKEEPEPPASHEPKFLTPAGLPFLITER